MGQPRSRLSNCGPPIVWKVNNGDETLENSTLSTRAVTMHVVIKEIHMLHQQIGVLVGISCIYKCTSIFPRFD